MLCEERYFSLCSRGPDSRAWRMTGKRYDIGNLESYESRQNHL